MSAGHLYPIDRRAAGPSVVFVVQRQHGRHWTDDSEHRNCNFAHDRAGELEQKLRYVSRVIPRIVGRR